MQPAGLQIAIDTAVNSQDEQVAEGALHVLCSCAACHTPSREVMVAKGALKGVAVALQAASMDTKVSVRIPRSPCLMSCVVSRYP